MNQGLREADALLRSLAQAGWTLAVAESLTGGLLAARIVAIAGASRSFRGGAVTYATETKADLLGVDRDLLAERGPVDPEVAAQMAAGVRRLFRADVGVSTTGVAGPGGHDGKEPGHVYIAVITPQASQVRRLQVDGGRSAVRDGTVSAALTLATALVAERSPGDREQS